ncbi:hypothetical protein MATL_G00020840 [Megalops atlanticus]|uniref:Centriole, cilia and spindle-associated protein n=1 Tax=Megalops atlanticus TaxID=7932 RepID=A0A9D3QMG7_MEGAT|nr:hypothetical protein MATL_G00020840 [Megalops atlanticus]
MVTKKIRTEYMKKFKDPKWETYSKCYEDSLKYRLTRRLLEQAHKPWFWEGWDSGSESSGRSTPRNRNKIKPLKLQEASPIESENETCEAQGQAGVPEDTSDLKYECPEKAEPPAAAVAPDALFPTDMQGLVNGYTAEEEREPGEEPNHSVRPHTTRSEPDCNRREPSNPQPRRKPARAKSQPPQESMEKLTGKEHRSFTGWAEKQADTVVDKTHNVCTSASGKEIHPAALHTKTRREVEKHGRTLDRRRARSADLEKAHKAKLDPMDDPWMTEYMRCFSARSR